MISDLECIPPILFIIAMETIGYRGYIQTYPRFFYKHLFSIDDGFITMYSFIYIFINAMILSILCAIYGTLFFVNISGKAIAYNMMLLMYLTCKTLNASNNILLQYHKHIAKWLAVLIMFHTISYIVPLNAALYELPADESPSWRIMFFPIRRLFASVCFIVFFITLLTTVFRNMNYHVFSVLHFMIGISLYILTFFHRKEFFYVMCVSFFIFFIDRIKAHRCSKTIEATISHSCCDDLISISWKDTRQKIIGLDAGSYAFFNFPDISSGWNPFTIVPNLLEEQFSIIIRKKHNITKKIMNSKSKNIIQLKRSSIFGHSFLMDMDHYVFIALGVGITSFLSLFQIPNLSITFIWIVPDISYIQEFRKFIRNPDIKFIFFIKNGNKIDESFQYDNVEAFFKGRPTPTEVLMCLLKLPKNHKVLIKVCGGKDFIGDIKDACFHRNYDFLHIQFQFEYFYF